MSCLAWVVIGLIVAGSVTAGGCLWIYSEVKDHIEKNMAIENGVLKSEAYEYQLRVPDAWLRLSAMFPDADVAAGVLTKGRLGLVTIAPPLVPGESLQQRLDDDADDLAQTLVNGTRTEVEDVTIGDLPGAYARLAGVEDGEAVVMHWYVIQGRQLYVIHLICTEAEAESLETEYKRIAFSFLEN